MSVLKFFGRAFLSFFVGLWHFVAWAAKKEAALIVKSYKFVIDYTSGSNDPENATAKDSVFVRYLIRFILLPTVPIVAFVPIFFAAAIVTGIFGGIDQATAPNFDVNPRLVAIDSTPDDGKPATENDIGIALLEATHNQFSAELATPVAGWTPNDVLGLQYWDNRVNRELGVRQATIAMMDELKNITNLGNNDVFDQRILNAQQGFNTNPYWWMDPGFAESGYNDAIESLDSFISDVRSSEIGSGAKHAAIINITNEDKKDIFVSLDEIFGIANGRLIESASLFGRWFQTDDDVYYAKGLALVVRDILVVMRNGYEGEFRQRGFLTNIDEALSELEGIISFHPVITFTSKDDSMIPDHRAKLSQKIGFVRGRLENAIRSYNN